MAQTITAFGPISFDPASGTLRGNGADVRLGQRAAALLQTLIDADHQPVSKSALLEAAWPGMVVEDGSLTVQIAALRKALGTRPDGQDWIVTVPRVGYRLIPPQATGPTPEPASRPALAVLPFQNLSGEAETDYFADGVVADIITALGRFQSFSVVARNSSFAYKGRSLDARRVALDLDARYLLEGSVRRAAERLRITTQLVDGETGQQIWAQNFDGTVGDIFDFQDRITESVATLIEPQIQLAAVEHSRRERPTSLAAYDLYLRALHNYTWDSQSDNADAYHLLNAALELEPDNSIILAYAARTLTNRNLTGWPPLGPDDDGRCAVLVRRALKHAGADATVLALCGDALMHVVKDYDWAMTVLRTALEANPNDVQVVTLSGIVNLHCGDVADALAFFHRAIRLSPRDPNAHLSLTGIAHAMMIGGDYLEAIDWANRALTLSPNNHPTFWMLIAANAQLGRMDEAHRFLRDFRKFAPDATVAGIWAGQPQKDLSRCAGILEGLRLAGLPET